MNKVKKYVARVLMLVIALAAFTGCSKEKDVEIDIKSMAENMKNEVGFKDEMSLLEAGMFEYLYEIDESLIKDKVVYVSTGATAEEIAIFEAVDKDAAEEIKNGVSQRIEDQKESFESYIPEEMVKLNNPVLEVKGKYVILCISDNNDKAKEIIG